MLLGLPHGCSDSILKPQFKSATNNISLEHHFTHQCAVVAGRIIERNVASAKLPYSELMAIDEEMDTMADAMSQSWWAIPDNLLFSDIANLRERLLLHFYFFHVRLYLHLPSMRTSQPIHAASTTCISRLACIAAARELLKRFNILNMTTPEGKRLFECKTSIFVAFTGAVVLALGMRHPVDLRYNEVDSQEEDERQLLNFYAALQDEEQRNGCNVSSQCRIALGALLTATPHSDDQANLSANEIPCEIRIPYFGKILRLKARDGERELRPAELSLPSMTEEILTSNARDSWIYEYPETIVSTSLLTCPDGDNLLDTLDMDLDWDWASLSITYNEMG